MSNQGLPSNEELQRIMHSFTPDQLGTCHLLYLVFLLNQKDEGVREIDLPCIKDYLRKATEVVNSLVNHAKTQELLIDIFIANTSLFEEVQKALNEPKWVNNRFSQLSDYILRHIILNCTDLLGNKTFLKTFKDIFFTNDGYASSPKAVIIVYGLIQQFLKQREENLDDSTSKKDTESSSIADEENAHGILDHEDFDEEYEDENYEEYDVRHPYIKSWETVKSFLSNLPLEEGLVFHAISLLMSHTFLRRDFYPKYQKAVVKALATFKGDAPLNKKKQALANANDAFVQLKESVLDYIFNGHDYRAVALKNDLFTLATDMCLSFVKNSMTHDKAQQLLEGIKVYKDGISVNLELESYAFAFYLSADHEYQKMFGKKIEDVYLGDDWTDYEEDNTQWYDKKYGYYDLDEYDDYDSDQELISEDPENSNMKSDTERQLDEYFDKVAKIVHSLDIEKDFLFHCVNLKMMERVVKPRIYSKYYRAVVSLVEEFNTKNEESSVPKARKDADEILLSRYKFLYREADYNVRKGKIEEFYLLSEALRSCLIEVRKMTKEEISKIISSIDFNSILKTYFGNDIDSLAVRYLDLAREEILSNES